MTFNLMTLKMRTLNDLCGVPLILMVIYAECRNYVH